MTDQAEALRKRREARQKKILASGESRLHRITGGSNAQVAPSPAFIQAREEMLRKEQEEERLKALRAAGGIMSGDNASSSSLPQTSQYLEAEEEELVMPSSASRGPTGSRRASEQAPSSNPDAGVPAASHTSSNTESHTTSTSPSTSTSATVQDPSDADPDESLGAPQAYTPSAQQNPFMNNPFFPQNHHALTRMAQQDNSRSNNDNKAPTQHQPGDVPPGFTVVTPQVDPTARWWKLLHFVLSVLFGVAIVYREYKVDYDLERFADLAKEKPLPHGPFQVLAMPVFWYFITMELILQSTRMYLYGMTASPSSILATIAGVLPSPFSDAILVFMRYRLIWTAMVNDLSVVVFIVGLTIAFAHMLY